MSLDVTAYRNLTPAVAHETQLNAASASLPPWPVTETFLEYVRLESERGPHWTAAAARPVLEAGRADAAELLGCAPHNIAFGEVATRLWGSALGAVRLRPGARLLIAKSDWGGNHINAIRLAEAAGAVIEPLPILDDGGIDVERLAGLVDDRVAAICVSAVASSHGILQPVAEIGRLQRPEHCLYFVDAAQAAGQRPAGLAAWNADVVTAPARKWLRGPRGQAVMAVSDRALAQLREPPVLDIAGCPWSRLSGYDVNEDATRFESFEHSVAARAAFGSAIRYALKTGVEKIGAVIGDRLVHARRILSEVPGLKIQEGPGSDPAFLTFTLTGFIPRAVAAALAERSIHIAAVEPNTARADLVARGLLAVCRLSPHAYSTVREIDRCAGELLDLVRHAPKRHTPVFMPAETGRNAS